MKEISRFPAKAGELGWFALSRFKNHTFSDVQTIKKNYDFVIIGGGFAGINAAHQLAEKRPDAHIAIFEALKIGMGDSGRNAGFLIDIPHSFGEPGVTIEQHRYRMHLNKIAINRLSTLKTRYDLDIDWIDSGKYLAARENRYLKNINGMAEILDKLNVETRIFEHDELCERLGTNYYIKALYTAGTQLINPSETVRALASALPNNVEVFEETPVIHIDDDQHTTIRLANGKMITAGKLLLLSGVFIDRFGIKKKGRMTPAGSFGAFTRELTPQEMSYFKNIPSWGCTSAHAAGTTVRLTNTNRIYVRNGLIYPRHLNLSPDQVFQARQKLRKSFENRFPNLKHVNFEYVYGGMIPLTMNGASFFFQKSKNVFAAAVGDGCGLTRSTMLGYYLANLVCGEDSEELRCLIKTSHPAWCPPEPFKSIGANAQMKLQEILARGEV